MVRVKDLVGNDDEDTVDVNGKMGALDDGSLLLGTERGWRRHEAGHQIVLAHLIRDHIYSSRVTLGTPHFSILRSYHDAIS